METKIINLLKQHEKKLSLVVLEQNLKVNPDELLNLLKAMDEQNIIALTLDLNVYLVDQEPYFKGHVKLHPKGFGFVTNFHNLEGDDFFIPPVSLNNAISDDVVVYQIQKDNFQERDATQPPRFKANVVEVASREKEFLVGELKKSFDGRFLDFIPTDQSLNSFRIVMVNKKEFQLDENLLLKAKILRSEGRKLFVKLIKVIGSALKAADRIVAIAEEFNIKIDFNKNTLSEAQKAALTPDQQVKELNKRTKRSLIGKTMVTIDGIDSKDLDDSIGVEKVDDQHYRLIVAIADVAHYVQPKTFLDREALIRGNSTYLVNTVIPMLPEVLSNGVCSLNPNEKKFVLVCEMIFDLTGKMVEKQIYESVMVSVDRLNYDQVNKYYATKEIDSSVEVRTMLTHAFELHHILNQERNARGTINFEIREPKVILDKDANVVQISSRATGESEKLIENFMVSANEAVAETIYAKELPFIYRNHGRPESEKLLEWYATLINFGIDVKLTDKQKLDPKNLNHTLNQIAKQISESLEVELLNLSLLRYMDKAKYGLINIGHFGLASKCYTHFTSPIRRYSDLIVHRYLKQYLIRQELDAWKLEHNAGFIEKASLIINDTEQNSIDTEREVIKVCMVEYMQDKVGQEFVGVVVTALKFGTFIQLENMVEGLVHISEFPQGTFYNEKSQSLITPQNKIYKMGDKVKVKLVKADLPTRKIDFQLVN